MDDDLVEGVSAVVAAEAKSKDDDLDLALDALRDCDTDFIKFDQVWNTSLSCTLSQVTYVCRKTPSPTKKNKSNTRLVQSNLQTNVAASLSR